MEERRTVDGGKSSEQLNDSSQQLKTTDELIISAFYRVPVELRIWELILFDYVNPARDLYKAYNSWSGWKSILESTKSSWMFAEVFPLFVERLSKQEILKCRLVCKRWCHGVDYFCENNVVRRPAFGEDEEDLSFKLDIRHKEYRTTYGYNTFYPRWLPLKPNEKFLREAVNHPRNPIVGRCVMVVHCRNPLPRQEHECNLGNQILEKFGRYIHFLQICFYDTTPVEFFKSFVELFQFCDLSNLKSLEIKKVAHMEFVRERKLCSQINEYIANLTSEQKSRFPKNLETLICDFSEANNLNINQTLMDLFSASIKTLEICKDTFTYPLRNQLAYLCDLRTKIDTDDSLQSLFNVTSPIRRLQLTVGSNNLRNVLLTRNHLLRVMTAINKFRDTLMYLKLTIRRADCNLESFLNVDRLDLANIPTVLEGLSPLTNLNSLDLPNIRTIVLGTCPLSFNFICGLSSLQYLHISRILVYEETIFLRGNIDEKLDISQKLKNSYDRERRIMRYPNLYESNVWSVFERLKVITIEVHETLRRRPNLWEYRRNHYEMR